MRENMNREAWADLSRGLGIIAIFSIHYLNDTQFSESIFTCLLAPIAIPIFYFVSGYFASEKRKPISIIKHSFKTIVVPYLFASFVFFLRDLIYFALEKIDLKSLLQIFASIFLQIPKTAYEGARWFFPSFFVAKVVYDILFYKLKGNLKKLSAVCFILAGAAWIYNLLGGIRLPWNVETALLVQPFFLMGSFYKNSLKDKISSLSKNKKITLGCSSMIIYLLFTICNKMIGKNNIDFHELILNEFFTAYISAGCGIALIIALACLLKKLKVLSFIGKNTMAYYLYSPIPNAVGFKIVNMLGVSNNFASYIISLIISMALTAVIVVVLNRFFPWMLGKKKIKA